MRRTWRRAGPASRCSPACRSRCRAVTGWRSSASTGAASRPCSGCWPARSSPTPAPSGAADVHDGGYASYLAARADRAEREAAVEHKRRNLARAELAWLRRGAPARTRKPKADVAASRSVVERRAPESARADDLPLAELVQMPRLGDTVVELHGVSDGYGDHLLFEGVDLLLGPGDRLGVVGVNLPLDGRVREVVAGPARQPDWTDAALLERLWFGSDAQWAPIRLLSGGERRRLQFAPVLRTRPNLLVLDGPTNDLDLDTLRAIEEMLDLWPGTLVVASHDRAFLERTVEDVIVLDGHGRARKVPGGYAAYEADRRARPPPGRPGRGRGVGAGGGGGGGTTP